MKKLYALLVLSMCAAPIVATDNTKPAFVSEAESKKEAEGTAEERFNAYRWQVCFDSEATAIAQEKMPQAPTLYQYILACQLNATRSKEQPIFNPLLPESMLRPMQLAQVALQQLVNNDTTKPLITSVEKMVAAAAQEMADYNKRDYSTLGEHQLELFFASGIKNGLVSVLSEPGKTLLVLKALPKLAAAAQAEQTNISKHYQAAMNEIDTNKDLAAAKMLKDIFFQMKQQIPHTDDSKNSGSSAGAAGAKS